MNSKLRLFDGRGKFLLRFCLLVNERSCFAPEGESEAGARETEEISLAPFISIMKGGPNGLDVWDTNSPSLLVLNCDINTQGERKEVEGVKESVVPSKFELEETEDA